MKQYFIPYAPGGEKVKYVYLFYLYSIAEYDKATKLYNTIHSISIQDTAGRINAAAGGDVISKATLSRFLNDEKNSNFFTYDTKNKIITLNNCFRHQEKAEKKQSFIVLSVAEFDFLLKQNDNLLIAYYLYLKYYCGISKSKTTDNTAKQFLAACGYSTKSNNYLSQISKYNSILTAGGFLSITKTRDEAGRERNTSKIK